MDVKVHCTCKSILSVLSLSTVIPRAVLWEKLSFLTQGVYHLTVAVNIVFNLSLSFYYLELFNR